MKCFPHRQTAARDHGRFIRCVPVTVDDDDLVIERGAEAGVLAAVDADVGTHVIAATDFRPPGTKPGPIAGHTAAHNGVPFWVSFSQIAALIRPKRIS